jgi:hypothetical protein
MFADTTEHPTSETEKNIDEGWLNGLLRGKPAHLHRLCTNTIAPA